MTAQATQDVKDFPDEVTGKTYSPVRQTNKNPRGSMLSNLVAYGRKRLSMATGGYPKSPDQEAEKTALSHKDFMPPTPEDEHKKKKSSSRRRSSISSLFSRKSNSPSVPHTPRSVLSEMENGMMEEEKACSEDGSHNSEELNIALDDDDGDDISIHEENQHIYELDEYNRRNTEEGGMEDTGKNQYHVLSKKHYKSQLRLLNRRRKWAETVIRRESEQFIKNYDKSGKAAMDQFIVAMSRGIVVKRHQGGCHAEEVRLYSDNGCHSIHWESPKVLFYICTLNFICR